MKTIKYTILTIFLLLSSCTEKIQDSETLGRKLMKIWESGEVEKLDLIMSSDAVYTAGQDGDVYDDPDEIKDYISHVGGFSKDFKVDIKSVKATETFSVLEWKMTGFQHKPVPGKISVPTNRKFTVNGVTIVEVENGKIIRATDYLDLLGFVVQLGAKVDLPGGKIIGKVD